MPKYFFHVRNGDELIEDPEGMELPNVVAARAEATQAARDVVAERVRFGSNPKGDAFEIWDENGLIESVSLRDSFSS
jgi:hypothetical protein